jgi:DNA invertase Pin-like site-specific DNA recombinase
MRYTSVSSVDQNPPTQLCDLRPLAAARGYEIVGEYTDTISGTKATRPGLDGLMADARRGRFDGVLLSLSVLTKRDSVTLRGISRLYWQPNSPDVKPRVLALWRPRLR